MSKRENKGIGIQKKNNIIMIRNKDACINKERQRRERYVPLPRAHRVVWGEWQKCPLCT